MFEELAKQIRDTSVKLEEQRGVAYATAWLERQMMWLGELKDGFEEAEDELKEGFKVAKEKLKRVETK